MSIQSPYGVTVLLDFVSGNVLPAAWASAAAGIGLGWIRMQISWHTIETAGGVYNWAAADQGIANIQAAGLDVFFDILNPPSFRKTITDPVTGAHLPSPADLASFVGPLCQRYSRASWLGHIAAIDLNNEGFDDQGGSPGLDGGYSADALNLCYPLAKCIDSSILVFGGAHLGINKLHVSAWETQHYTGGAASRSGGCGGRRDGWHAHFYRGVLIDPLDTTTEPNDCTILDLCSLIGQVNSQYGYAGLRGIISEVGWPATQNGDGSHVSYATQAQYLQKVLTTARTQQNVLAVGAYTINTSDSYSILDSSLNPLPAAQMVQQNVAQFPQQVWKNVGGSMPFDSFSSGDNFRITGPLTIVSDPNSGAAGKVSSDNGAFTTDGAGNVALGSLAENQTTGTVQTLSTSGTITTPANTGVVRVTAAAAVTGIILGAGSKPGQRLTVIHEGAAANTITYAAAGTSNVADGTSDVITGPSARTFVWDSITALWYPVH